jgi:hypothetical protein
MRIKSIIDLVMEWRKQRQLAKQKEEAAEELLRVEQESARKEKLREYAKDFKSSCMASEIKFFGHETSDEEFSEVNLFATYRESLIQITITVKGGLTIKKI